MNNLKYTGFVNDGKFAKLGGRIEVPLDNIFENHNGTINNLVFGSMSSAAIIRSFKGTVRANHYHNTDWHYAYVISGAILYFERKIGSLDIPNPHTFGPGEMFFTQPKVEHSMVFLEDTEFLTLAKNVRSHENHEADLTRVEFITEEILKKYVSPKV